MSSHSIHGFLSFSLDRGRLPPLGGLLWPRVSGKYRAFVSKEAVTSDFAFRVGDFRPQLDGCWILDEEAFVRDNYLFTRLQYKLARFNIAVSGWEEDGIRASVSCNQAGLLVLTGLIIDQLLLFGLVSRGAYPIHAACLADDGGAYLLAGSSGAGKTTAGLALMEEGLRLLGDNFALLAGGTVYGFASPMNIFSYNLVPSLARRLSRRSMYILRLKDLLWRMTGGYVKLSTLVHADDLWPELTGSASAMPKAVVLMMRGQEPRLSEVAPRSLARALVANMRLELRYLLKWLAQYTFVNPAFSVEGWVDRYEAGLAAELAAIPCLVRLNIPATPAREVSGHIAATLRQIGAKGT